MRSRSRHSRRFAAYPRTFLLTLFLLTGASLPAAAAEAWLPGPDLSVARNYFALVSLPSGDLLAPGGVIPNPGYTNRVDIFSVAGRSFSETTPMPNSHRNQKQAVLLGNGKVLIAGEQYDGVSRAHLFTESTHSWSTTVNTPALDRFAAAMILLPSGKVLYSGGYNGGGDGPTYDSAELFDPALSTWSSTGSMVALRAGHSLTLLVTGPNAGKVLVTGGGQRIGLTVEARCELYDPATGTFALTGQLNIARSFHTATRLLDGRVLVTGGHDTGFDGNNHNTAEIYDPSTGTWSFAAPMATRRGRHTATLLPNGDVLVIGGAQVGSLSSVTANAEIYHPALNAWRTVPAMSTARVGQAAALLPSGEVLVAGGYDGKSYLASSEIFLSPSNPPTAVAGASQTVRPGSQAHLDGSASSDDVTAGPNLLFSWTLTSMPAGSAAVLSGGTTVTPSFLADLPGTYIAQLVVTDEDGLASFADQVTVTTNAAPTAGAQTSATAFKVGTPVTLDATSSTDPENNPLTYQWKLSSAPSGSAAVIANAGTPLATLVPDVPGDYTVTLTVSDFLGAGVPMSSRITAAPQSVVEVPALSKEGALLLGTLLMIAALGALRRAG